MSSDEPEVDATPGPDDPVEHPVEAAAPPVPRGKKRKRGRKKAQPSGAPVVPAAVGPMSGDETAPEEPVTTQDNVSDDAEVTTPPADSTISAEPSDAETEESSDDLDDPTGSADSHETEAAEVAVAEPVEPTEPDDAPVAEPAEPVEPTDKAVPEPDESTDAAVSEPDEPTDEPVAEPAEPVEPTDEAVPEPDESTDAAVSEPDEPADDDEPTDAIAAAPAGAPPRTTSASGPELVDDPFVVADAAHGHHVDPVEGRAAWGRLLTMGRPRATRANLLVLLLAVVLGAAIAAQVQLTNERGLTELSQTDLVRVLDDVSVRSARLDQQVRELESTRDRLKSGTGTSAEALEQAQKRLDTLGILAGTVGAEGPGITLRISDPDSQVTGPVVLDLIQELRDGGAEAIDVGGVRVVASSFVGDSGGEVKIDGTVIERPFVIKAIGDSKTLASAMTIPGGIVESVRQKGANATVAESDSIEITSTHEPVEPTHAKPVE